MYNAAYSPSEIASLLADSQDGDDFANVYPDGYVSPEERRERARLPASIRITSARGAAPSFKRLKADGLPLPRKGNRPSSLVLIATDETGRDWEHERIFASHEFETFRKLQARVEAAGSINPIHWRRA
jgi:hypothetical protein